MNKKFNKIDDVINEFILNKYVYASKLFNDKYKDLYRVDISLDFDFLNIYLRNLKEEKYYKVQILNNNINYLSSDVILNCYEELIRKVV